MRFESRTAQTYFGLLRLREQERLARRHAELRAIRDYLAAKREMKYSPDQPRDERGRWTDWIGHGDDALPSPVLVAGIVIRICVLGSRSITTDEYGNHFWYGVYDCADGSSYEKRGFGKRIRGFIMQPR